MSTITRICTVGHDGNVIVPVGIERAGTKVTITFDSPESTAPQSETADEQWREFVNRTAGSIDDPEFKRHDQGEFEQRLPLE